jgi:hypothetical protein
MALKFWYKAANGSDNWATAANWYNGSGGTGGLAGVPTAADDVVIDAASGSGAITIAAAATCLSINFIGFTGTLAGTSTLAFLGDIILSSSMTLTYSGTATLGNGYCTFTSNGKIVTFNITVNNVGATFILNDALTMSSTNTFTLSAGFVSRSALTSNISVGFFVSTGSAVRVLDAEIYLTAVGTVWNVSGTNFGISTSVAYIINSSSSAKTISHTPSTAAPGYGFRQIFHISGAGTGSYTLTGNFQDLYFANTGGASFSFGNSNIAGTLDLGTSNPTCNMVWNNIASQTLTWNADDSLTMNIGPNITITASPALSYTNATGYYATINNPYNKSLTGAITINTPAGGLTSPDNLRTTSTITVTSGLLQINDVYCSSISSSNSNIRDITIYGSLYLTGTGTLVTATTTTNLTTSIRNIHVINSTATAKSLTLNSVFYPIYDTTYGGGLYLAGSGSGTITLSAGTSALYPIYVTNIGGAAISFSTATILSLEFSTGTNAVWSNSTSQTLTITDSLYIAASAGNPTLTPALIFTGNSTYAVSITLNGKSLVGGTCTINDTSLAGNQIIYTFYDNFSSNAAFTVTSANEVYFNGAFSGTSFTCTSANQILFYSSLTLTGALSLANNAQANTVLVAGNFSAASISHLATGLIDLTGTTNNVTTSITLNNAASLAYFSHSGTLTTTTFTITNGSLTSIGNLNCTTFTIGYGNGYFFDNIITLTGIFTLTAGTLFSQNSTFSSTTFVSTVIANSRNIDLNNSSWTLTGTGTVWNVADGGSLSANMATLDINITNTSVTAITFAGAGLYYRYLFIRRGAINANQVIITGNNTFQGLYHTGGSTQTLTFTGGGTTIISDTFAVGSSSAVTNINSTSSSIPFNIVKQNPGLVICNNVSITRSAATPADTWYAINSTNVAGNSGWIFGPPSRRLSSLGTG